jgi:hypothetical protein
MSKSKLLLLDSAINFLLGILLLIFQKTIVNFLGVPYIENAFYPNILGAVLFGIGIALSIEYFRGAEGLGLLGAISINLCGGIVLAYWLLFGQLGLSINGKIFLWSLAVILVGISSIELVSHSKHNR